MRTWPTPYIPPVSERFKHNPLKIFDSYKGEKIELEPTIVASYICGITPYDATHLGHAATYLTFDLMHRYLLASGATLQFTENITDIDDPLFERARQTQENWAELAQTQIDLFVDDMTALHVVPPQKLVTVTEAMGLIIQFIDKLISLNKTYSLGSDLYLDLSSVDHSLDRLPIPLVEALKLFAERGGDPDRMGKRHPLDPLLWRACAPDEPQWSTNFGDGRPGWHIECTAIALEGQLMSAEHSITVQGGGSDLSFPHHFMTAIQGEAVTNKPFAKVFVHTGMIGLDGEKMSKSLGNLVFVSELRQRGISSAAIRVALMLNHYRSDRSWDDAKMNQAQKILDRVMANCAREECAETTKLIQSILDSLSDDLNTPAIFVALEQWCIATENGEVGGSPGELTRALDTYLGIVI
jgi:L-cysteine:1D-myo-inositol 2-amino-2-deoxy-alpha-D-glucopyranoside ligase